MVWLVAGNRLPTASAGGRSTVFQPCRQVQGARARGQASLIVVSGVTELCQPVGHLPNWKPTYAWRDSVKARVQALRGRKIVVVGRSAPHTCRMADALPFVNDFVLLQGIACVCLCLSFERGVKNRVTSGVGKY